MDLPLHLLVVWSIIAFVEIILPYLEIETKTLLDGCFVACPAFSNGEHLVKYGKCSKNFEHFPLSVLN